MTVTRAKERGGTTRTDLESRLLRPDVGENGHVDGAETRSRLGALRRLGEMMESGDIVVVGEPGGINTHVHTAKSFSYFASPSDAAWQAKLAGVRVFGINDHYTIDGHAEFSAACEILDIEPLFSMEAVATWEDAASAGATVNDPNNPGRTYLTAKGVTRSFPAGCAGERDLARMNRALLERNRAMTAKLASLIESRLGLAPTITFDGVLALTPHDRPTERHVAQAAALFLEAAYAELDERCLAASTLLETEVDATVLTDAAAFQDLIRARTLKMGRPAYVEESTEAFIPVERMVALCLDLGAIPTYPVLGNPVTPWEEDLDTLYDRLEALGIHAIEVIPDRNTVERLLDIVEKAVARGFPVLSGTEHNTKSSRPLVDRFFFDERFRPHFERGAQVVIEHQASRRGTESR